MVTPKHKLTLIILALLIVVPLVSAIPTIKQNEDVFISKSARLNGAITSSVGCNITLRDPDDQAIINLTGMTFNSNTGQVEFFIASGNHSKLGVYTYPVSCTDGNLNKTKIYQYEINPSGKAYIPQITGPLIFGAILTLMFISFVLLVFSSKIELFPMKVFLMILSGMIAIINIGFVAGSFQEFFSTGSTLSGAFGTLYIMFIILLTGASIFLMIWVILTGFKLYRIKRGFFIAE